jgi:hypothetical protein
VEVQLLPPVEDIFLPEQQQPDIPGKERTHQQPFLPQDTSLQSTHLRNSQHQHYRK